MPFIMTAQYWGHPGERPSAPSVAGTVAVHAKTFHSCPVECRFIGEPGSADHLIFFLHIHTLVSVVSACVLVELSGAGFSQACPSSHATNSVKALATFCHHLSDWNGIASTMSALQFHHHVTLSQNKVKLFNAKTVTSVWATTCVADKRLIMQYHKVKIQMSAEVSNLWVEFGASSVGTQAVHLLLKYCRCRRLTLPPPAEQQVSIPPMIGSAVFAE